VATLVLIPVKSFSRAKARLSPALDGAARAQLAERLATGVVTAVAAAAGAVRVVVVGDDPSVARWAEGLGARGITVVGDLNVAATEGLSLARREGFERALLAHGDLLHPGALPGLIEAEDAVIVPDRHREGTNVIALPTRLEFPFSYGPGSFSRHVAAAAALGIGLRVVDDLTLGVDVDTPEDLALDPEVIGRA
jgi:2-phospho-L-lactate guanylyltransferase